MKVLVLSNNAVSGPLIEWLADREDVCVQGSPLTAGVLDSMKPDLVISYSYRHMLRREVLDVMPGKFVNLHISLLPYNRGADPNAWSFLEGTPKGVTIHFMDAGIDTGPILLQREVCFDVNDTTLAASYRALHDEIRTLFCDNWHALRECAIRSNSQVGAGTFHRAADFAALREQLLGNEGWNVPIPLFRARYRRICRAGAES